MPATEQATVKPEIDVNHEHRHTGTWEDALSKLHARNPNIETNRPQDLDWQTIKSEGRRY